MKLSKIVMLMAFLSLMACNSQEEDEMKIDVETSLIWERIFPKGVDNGNKAAVHSIVQDASSNVYIIGEYRDAISFNAEGQDDFSLLLDNNSRSNRDGFVLKMDADGNSVWVRTIATPGNDFFVDGVLSNNKLYIAGNESLLWVIDLEGNELNKNQFSSKDDEITDLHLSADGEVYFTGSKQSGPEPYNNFYGKFTEDGEVAWQKEFILEDNFEQRAKIATNSDGYIYVAGNHTKERVFINKMDASGTVIWTKYLDAEQALLEQFLITNDDQLFIAGKFVGSKTEGLSLGIDLDPGEGVQRFLATSAGYDQFIVLLDEDGEFIWGDDLYSKGFNTAFLEAKELNGEVLLTFDTYLGVTSGAFQETEQLIDPDASHDGFLRIDLSTGTVSTYNFSDSFEYPAGIPEAFTLLDDGTMVYAKFLNSVSTYQGLLISRQKF